MRSGGLRRAVMGLALSAVHAAPGVSDGGRRLPVKHDAHGTDDGDRSAARCAHRGGACVDGGDGVRGYSGPEWLMPTERQQARLERFNGSGFATAVDERGELFIRQFPVETRYFASRPHHLPPCVDRAQPIPRPAARCRDGAEAKHHCALAPGGACVVWSVGSNGQTCFEEEWHAQAPGCEIHVFDPTLSAPARRRLDKLERDGVLRFHAIGLSSRALQRRDAPTAPTPRRSPSHAAGRAPFAPSTRAATLGEMMRALNTSWIDYLKIDCESCEFGAITRFLDEAGGPGEGAPIPVTQLQMEVHVPGSGLAQARAWAAHGIGHTDPTSRRYRGYNVKALRMLSRLLEHGFVVFHIALGGAHRFQCCGAEYTLLNTRAPAQRLQPSA